MSENAKDMAFGEDKGLTKAMLDRLTLDEGRIEAMAKGLEDIVALPDPVGAVTDACRSQRRVLEFWSYVTGKCFLQNSRISNAPNT